LVVNSTHSTSEAKRIVIMYINWLLGRLTQPQDEKQLLRQRKCHVGHFAANASENWLPNLK
ncbi:MAG: hypothetical protein Q7U74_07615, partial [Saprospiraceae bacterium]|nr:hypothetical protein [Saprospiraceae bacterium]